MNEETAVPAEGNHSPCAVSKNSIWLSDALRSQCGPTIGNETGKTKITLIRAFKERSRIIFTKKLIPSDVRKPVAVRCK